MNNQTCQKLHNLRLTGMAEAYQEICADKSLVTLSADELITLMVDREDARRNNAKLLRLIHKASFEQPSAHISDIDYAEGRMLDRSVVMRLASCDYISQGRNIVVMGATGSGKSYLACALGILACKQLYSVRFTRMRTLLEDLKMASEFRQNRLIKELKKCNLLIVDDWMLSSVDEKESILLYDLIHDRELSLGTSTMLCTQYDLKGCALKMTGKIISDAIYDRLENDKVR